MLFEHLGAHDAVVRAIRRLRDLLGTLEHTRIVLGAEDVGALQNVGHGFARLSCHSHSHGSWEMRLRLVFFFLARAPYVFDAALYRGEERRVGAVELSRCRAVERRYVPRVQLEAGWHQAGRKVAEQPARGSSKTQVESFEGFRASLAKHCVSWHGVRSRSFL